ncbi:MAG: hypothetical protein QG604_95 [Candidatus Dependentiae bacterium]|nr:hypothetical protein [Candidatus Dependentiae bacterium]
MQLRKGFLLLEIMVYGALALLGVMFFTAALNTSLNWCRRTQYTLATFLYHYHALMVMQKDLSCSVTCTQIGPNAFVASGTTLDAHWNEVPWRIAYECRKNRLFRKKVTMPNSAQEVKSSIGLAPAPEKLLCERAGAAYMVTYTAAEAWHLHIDSLVRKEAE